MKKCIGVLGLQGDFSLHRQSLIKCGCTVPIVKHLRDLDACDGLILPGGESTTLVKLLKNSGLFEGIQEFSRHKPLMGTCAGLIILAAEVSDGSIDSMGLIDITVERNGYGRQKDSFIDTLTLPVLPGKDSFEGVFIRAPKIMRPGKDVTPLGFHGEDTVMAGNGRVLVMTFHPELTGDLRIHKYFLDAYVSQAR